MESSRLTINTDGGSRGNPGPAAIGVTAKNQDGVTLFELSEYLGIQSNNYAEYSAVIHALDHLITHNQIYREINFILDSELIVRQINGQYKVKEPTLIKLHQMVKNKIQQLKKNNQSIDIIFQNVPRNQNKRADTLVNLALDQQQ